jgi:hypothetical protein
VTDKPVDSDEIANEITAAARVAREAAERAEGKPQPGEGKKWPIKEIGIGIGSAALAAAGMYAARRNTKD